ncbi:unnamed protein product [Spirodela intermedia]|uniref:TF-B3 domain-containing protein n=1 Tax=Spirodela intermedia TaxID=51605 RepID=A0A7I8JE01_SPIIN|nr:unnamed protein product [Spirodela intermedia]CAA6668329.1 unnamed protein product [Spirodela intermedia]
MGVLGGEEKRVSKWRGVEGRRSLPRLLRPRGGGGGGGERKRGGRRALAEGEFLRAVRGFGPSRRKKRSARQRRLVVGPFSPADAATAAPPAPSPASHRKCAYLTQLKGSEMDLGISDLYFDKEAEAHLPVLMAREGIYMCMEDMETSHMWTFKYRFWPNNKSRMYILENTGDFVKRHGLRLGDFVMLYRDDYRQRYSAASRSGGAKDHLAAEVADCYAGYSDAYDDMCLAMDASFAFSADFTVGLPNGILDSPAALESVPSLGSIENLSLDDFS